MQQGSNHHIKQGCDLVANMNGCTHLVNSNTVMHSRPNIKLQGDNSLVADTLLELVCRQESSQHTLLNAL